MSNFHCFLGYENEAKKFFVIDFGSSGKGSTNGTYIKIKNDVPFLLTKGCILRIVSLPKIDYSIRFDFNFITTK